MFHLVESWSRSIKAIDPPAVQHLIMSNHLMTLIDMGLTAARDAVDMDMKCLRSLMKRMRHRMVSENKKAKCDGVVNAVQAKAIDDKLKEDIVDMVHADETEKEFQIAKISLARCQTAIGEFARELYAWVSSPSYETFSASKSNVATATATPASSSSSAWDRLGNNPSTTDDALSTEDDDDDKNDERDGQEPPSPSTAKNADDNQDARIHLKPTDQSVLARLMIHATSIDDVIRSLADDLAGSKRLYPDPCMRMTVRLGTIRTFVALAFSGFLSSSLESLLLRTSANNGNVRSRMTRVARVISGLAATRQTVLSMIDALIHHVSKPFAQPAPSQPTLSLFCRRADDISAVGRVQLGRDRATVSTASPDPIPHFRAE